MTSSLPKARIKVDSEDSARKRLAGWLEKNFLVRFHVMLILLFAFGVGLLTTRGFLQLGLETMHWRWPLALFASYGAFLLALRLWLSYIGLGRYLEREWELDIDIPDVSNFYGSGSSGGSASSSVTLESVGDVLPAGGGQFSGAGASGDFAEVSGPTSSIDLPDIDIGGADEGCLPIVILAIIFALLAAVFGVGIYLVWQAPVLLAEVAFEAAMAAGLVRTVRKVDQPGWVGGALAASWKPFALILVFSVIAAILAEKYAPEARTLPQAVQHLKR